MPFATVIAPVTDAAVGRHVFVSYARADLQAALLFMDKLYALAASDKRLRLAKERIFFDQDRLRAGDEFGPLIESQLLLADLFLLLVSDKSLTSPYCLDKELAIAVAQGARIVPVLLADTPRWAEFDVPGDPKGRKLGAFDAVPIHPDNGRPQFIVDGNWRSPSLACSAAASQIAEALDRGVAALPVGCAAPAAAGKAAPRRERRQLLPYFCNQVQPVNAFEGALDRWTGERALVLLLRGEMADDVPGFWGRICYENLAGYCEAEKLPLGEVKEFELPRAADVGPAAADIAVAVRRNVSVALFEKARPLRSGVDLARLLTDQVGLLPVCAWLRDQPVQEAAAVLGALLAMIEEAPAGAPLRRLVVAVVVEGAQLLAHDKLIAALALDASHPRVLLAETPRLSALTRDDVSTWYRLHKLEAAVQIDEVELTDRLFQGAETLRHRRFAQQLRPLLGLASKDWNP